MRRPPVLLIFLVFCIAGIVAGLAFAWLVAPMQPAGVTPDRLSPTERELVIRLIADSFAADGDRDAAARRLNGLGPAAEGTLVEMIASDLTKERPSVTANNLIGLAEGLTIGAPIVKLLARPAGIPPATPSASSVPTSADITATPAAKGQFELTERVVFCSAGDDANRIEINIIDSDGQPQAGVAITVFWDDGRDSFFTGFTPNQGPGYADFTMKQGAIYSVAIAEDEVSVAGLEPQLCADGRMGGWRLEYRARES